MDLYVETNLFLLFFQTKERVEIDVEVLGVSLLLNYYFLSYLYISPPQYFSVSAFSPSPQSSLGLGLHAAVFVALREKEDSCYGGRLCRGVNLGSLTALTLITGTESRSFI